MRCPPRPLLLECQSLLQLALLRVLATLFGLQRSVNTHWFLHLLLFRRLEGSWVSTDHPSWSRQRAKHPCTRGIRHGSTGEKRRGDYHPVPARHVFSPAPPFRRVTTLTIAKCTLQEFGLIDRGRAFTRSGKGFINANKHVRQSVPALSSPTDWAKG